MSLSDDEISVIKSRFGLIDGELKSVAELAALSGKKIQEIQTLELEIMKKLRHPSRSGVLREFLD
jgi:RNA polymerase primary sigma factor